MLPKNRKIQTRATVYEKLNNKDKIVLSMKPAIIWGNSFKEWNGKKSTKIYAGVTKNKWKLYIHSKNQGKATRMKLLQRMG